MPFRRFALACLVLAAPLFAVAADKPATRVELTIEGLRPELEEAVESGLTLQQYRQREIGDTQLRRLAVVGDKEILAILEAWGHYEGKVTHRIESRPEGGFHVWYQVTPGEPVRVRASEISVAGEAGSEPAVKSALEAFRPRIGERFDHAQYETSKQAVKTALTDHGYLAASLTAHRVEVNTAGHSADIHLSWEGGPPHTFGPTTFTGGQFTPEFMERFVPWTEGERYSSSKVLDMQRRLVNGDYFATVTVTPQTSGIVEHAVPIDVNLTPAKRNIYSAALYASTDRGLGVELGAQRRWLNSRGHKGRADIDYAQRYQAIELSYRIPLPGHKQRVLGLATTYRDETTESSVSQTEKVVANVSRKWSDFTFVYGLQFLAGDFEIGSERGNSSLTFLEGAFTQSHSDQATFSRRGFSYTLSGRFTPVESLTDTRFASVQLESKWLHAIGENTRLILRGEVGTMEVDDFNQLPPELRFYSGGDRSIRGFGYEEIGSRNAAGDVIGGDRLVEANADLEWYFRKNLGAAVFVDAGDSFLGDDFVLHMGAGVGVRWKSPVGVMRLDLAYPIESIDSNGWQIHFNIGPDF